MEGACGFDPFAWGEREGERERGRKRGREKERGRGRGEGERDRMREGERKGERESGREGGREGGRERENLSLSDGWFVVLWSVNSPPCSTVPRPGCLGLLLSCTLVHAMKRRDLTLYTPYSARMSPENTHGILYGGLNKILSVIL